MIDKPIDVEKTVEQIKDKPFNLPTGFVWCDVDISDD
jgi:glycylpeptide N-tetradecanoyltransferase